MTVRRKVEVGNLRESIISKGSEVKQDRIVLQETKKPVLIHIPQWLCDQIDDIVKRRAGMNRTAIILEAIQEKVEDSRDDV